MDKIDQKKRSEIMRSVKSTNTKLEILVLKELWKRGIRYRKNVKDLKGKPDIAIKKRKVVIFIDSCFWHYCPQHCRVPNSNREYWLEKLERNRKRDQEITNYYKDMKWNVLRIWEHSLKEEFEKTTNMIAEFIEGAKF